METERFRADDAMTEPVHPGALKHVLGARRLVVLTGAGMSHESGIATFREALTGLWARYRPEEMATLEAFRRSPARVFGWYLARRRQVSEATPHGGYHALVTLAARYDEATVVTQNVDGLHRRAGSQNVIELHGSLEAFRCADGGHPFDPGTLDALTVSGDEEVVPPSCPTCGSPIRPGVVWFGEALHADVLARAVAAVRRCDVLLVVGTSSLVYPAAGLPSEAAGAGAAVIEINPSSTPLSTRADVWWPSTAGAALSALAAAAACAEASR